MPFHVLGARASTSSEPAGFVVDTVQRLNANFGGVEVVTHLQTDEKPSRKEVKPGSSLRLLIAIRQANGNGAAEG